MVSRFQDVDRMYTISLVGSLQWRQVRGITLHVRILVVHDASENRNKERVPKWYGYLVRVNHRTLIPRTKHQNYVYKAR